MVNSYLVMIYTLCAMGIIGTLFTSLVSDASSQSSIAMNGNLSMPFKMGILAMPVMCTTPNELIESVAGAFGDTENNLTKQLMIEAMKKQMMISNSSFATKNTTEQQLQQSMHFIVCLPIMNEEIIQNMTGK